METTLARTFRHEHFGDLTVLNIEGKLWFIGKEVAARLGYVDTDKAIRQHVSPKFKRLLTRAEISKLFERTIPGFSNMFESTNEPADLAGSKKRGGAQSTNEPIDLIGSKKRDGAQSTNEPADLTGSKKRGGAQFFVIIKEAGLYQLAFKSRLPTAIEYTCWVADEVLPSIRETGTYTVPNFKPAVNVPPDVCKELNLINRNVNFKLFLGMQVLTVKDTARLFKVKRQVIYETIRTLKEGLDYIHLHGETLKRFKSDNPRLSKAATAMYIITINGLINISKFLANLANLVGAKTVLSREKR